MPGDQEGKQGERGAGDDGYALGQGGGGGMRLVGRAASTQALLEGAAARANTARMCEQRRPQAHTALHTDLRQAADAAAGLGGADNIEDGWAALRARPRGPFGGGRRRRLDKCLQGEGLGGVKQGVS